MAEAMTMTAITGSRYWSMPGMLAPST